MFNYYVRWRPCELNSCVRFHRHSHLTGNQSRNYLKHNVEVIRFTVIFQTPTFLCRLLSFYFLLSFFRCPLLLLTHSFFPIHILFSFFMPFYAPRRNPIPLTVIELSTAAYFNFTSSYIAAKISQTTFWVTPPKTETLDLKSVKFLLDLLFLFLSTIEYC
jgi:hypothetical protein